MPFIPILFPNEMIGVLCQGGVTEQIISVICHVTKHKYKLLLYLTKLNFKNGLPVGFSQMNTF